MNDPFGDAPLLDFSEGFELGDGDEDNDGFFATSHINFTGRRNLEGTELILELWNVVFKID